MVLRPGQRGVLGHVCDDLGQLVHFVRDFVDVDAAVVGFLLVIAIPARVQQNAIFLVLLGVQHVITFLAEPNTHEARLVRPVGFHSDWAAEPSALARARYGTREGSHTEAAPN